jgi:hypothetical protein
MLPRVVYDMLPTKLPTECVPLGLLPRGVYEGVKRGSVMLGGKHCNLVGSHKLSYLYLIDASCSLSL